MYIPATLTMEQVVDTLQQRELTLSSAESFTCGMFASMVGDIPGVSQTFVGGVITYSVAMKTALCEVPQSVIDDYGVVSAPVAVGMAEGCRRLSGSDVAVSFTGVAGPGPSDGLEPGTAFVAACNADRFVVGNLYSLLANRPLAVTGTLDSDTPHRAEDVAQDMAQLDADWASFAREHIYSIDACRLAVEPLLDNRKSIREYGVDAGLIALDTLVKKTQ